MPNWCQNFLTLENKELNFEEIVAPYCVDGKDINNPPKVISFEKIHPIPDELKNTTAPSQEPEEVKNELFEKYGASDWYDWCIKNWSTKWEPADSSEMDKGGVYFNTAWSPPIELVRELARKTNQTFVLWYYECGMAFAGRAFCRPDGELDDEFYEDCRQAPDDLREMFGIDDDYTDEDDEEKGEE